MSVLVGPHNPPYHSADLNSIHWLRQYLAATGRVLEHWDDTRGYKRGEGEEIDDMNIDVDDDDIIADMHELHVL